MIILKIWICCGTSYSITYDNVWFSNNHNGTRFTRSSIPVKWFNHIARFPENIEENYFYVNLMEKNIIKNEIQNGAITSYCRYVDDIFCVIRKDSKQRVLDTINNFDPNYL